MSRWYWYVAQDDELMMDLDGRVLLEIAESRIQRDLVPKGLVRYIYVTPSQNPDHFHFVVKLWKCMPVMQRMVWQLYLMDHVYRSVKNMFRVLDGTPSPSLLVSPKDWHETPPAFNGEHHCIVTFWRQWDATCGCVSHKDAKKIWDCPAHQRLRGKQ